MSVVIIMTMMTTVTSEVTEDGLRCVFSFYIQSVLAVSQVYTYSGVNSGRGFVNGCYSVTELT